LIDYATEFHTLAADSGWNMPAIKDAFVNGLNENIKDQLAPHETPSDFENLVDLAVGQSASGEGVGASPSWQERHHEPVPSDYPDLSRVQPCYHDLREVFDKTKATSLPPHRPWDCTIDLLPGAPMPKARLYAISVPERKAMDDYIEASLRSVIIHPSSSPAGAGFFFVGKKDGSLRPCIDYSALNEITVKNRYRLQATGYRPCHSFPPPSSSSIRLESSLSWTCGTHTIW
ncbi:hypothetical protein L3Q82_021923, partial [Scortum barcoo]